MYVLFFVSVTHYVCTVLCFSDPLVVFSGGMSYDRAGRTPCITVMTGKSTTVLEMEHAIIDFTVLCETPWQNGMYNLYSSCIVNG